MRADKLTNAKHDRVFRAFSTGKFSPPSPGPLARALAARAFGAKNKRLGWKRYAQLAVVLLSALALKLYYSNANVNQLRWILAPTSFLVQLVTGLQFEFESHAGYLSSDRTFVIAASCAGVNFLITAFVMLSLRRLWVNRSPILRNSSAALSWSFIPLAGLLAYITTLGANTVRIALALELREVSNANGWLNANQLHRLEGILIYFGFLLLLYLVSEKVSFKLGNLSRASDSQQSSAGTVSPALVSSKTSSLLQRSIFPLLIYYAASLGIPLVNRAYRQEGNSFWEHSTFVLVTPLVILALLAICDFFNRVNNRTNS